VDAAVREGRVVYGVTTGFGELKGVHIPPEDVRQLQLNLVRSHSAGVGPAAPREVVRAMLLLRAHSLAKGVSGVRPDVVEMLVEMLERRVTPVVPSQGSVGASGDLAPLAHLALVLIGEGEAFVGDQRLPGRAALARAGLEPVVLEAKEGLALINGTQLITAVGGLALVEILRLLPTADVAGALSLDALKGTDVAFDPRIQAIR
jgi:histidine ammonia-lyase